MTAFFLNINDDGFPPYVDSNELISELYGALKKIKLLWEKF